jgi:hypothetical protein
MRRFQYLELSDGDAINWAISHLDHTRLLSPIKYRSKFIRRARRVLPKWRKWAIERERLWYALIGIGEDTEIDHTIPLSRQELRDRFVKLSTAPNPKSVVAQHILRTIDNPHQVLDQWTGL